MKKQIKITAWLLIFTIIVSMMSSSIFVTQAATGTNGFLAPIEPIPDGIDVTYISTPEELAAIGGEDSTGNYYALSNDINLVDEWIPIENFHCTFDGRGYSINNLFILESSNQEYAGLFGETYATIKNVAVNIGEQGVTGSLQGFSGSSYAGGLAGYCGSNAIVNCYVTGNVSATSVYGGALAGGLVGYFIGGTISNCYAVGNVSASSTYNLSYAGGLIGYGSGTITSCYTTGNVSIAYSGGGSYVGGLIGSGGGTITSCYTTGNISNTATSTNNWNHAGGLIGKYLSTYGRTIIITNCYVTGNVSVLSDSGSYAGGLLGGGSDFVSITNCYATGDVSSFSLYSLSYVGRLINGLMEWNPVTGEYDIIKNVSIENCYRLSTQTIIGGIKNDSGEPLDDNQMKDKDNFNNWDFDNVWGYMRGVNNGYPILRVFFPIIYGDIDGDGEITAADATLILRYIENLEEFDKFQIEAANVFGDGTITKENATLILKYIVGLEDKLGP